MNRDETTLAPAVCDEMRTLMTEVYKFVPVLPGRAKRLVLELTNEEFGVLHQTNPASLPFLMTLLSTGSQLARVLVYETLETRCAHLISRDASDYVDAVMISSTSRRITNDDFARMRWNFGNVSSELGVNAYLDCAPYLDDFVSKYSFCALRDMTDTYWRSVAALLYSDPFDTIDEDEKHACTEYVEWTSKQDDLSAIIRLTVDRNTIVVSDLEAVLASQSGVTKSLTEGVL